MANIEKKILEKQLHSNAEIAAEEYIKQFADALVIQSKTIADLDGADEVQRMHVEKARGIVLTLSQNKSRLRDALLLIGSLLVGASLQGIFAEYSFPTPRPNWFVFYFVLGILGTILSVWGVLRK
jgi:hypothetical protein